MKNLVKKQILWRVVTALVTLTFASIVTVSIYLYAIVGKPVFHPGYPVQEDETFLSIIVPCSMLFLVSLGRFFCIVPGEFDSSDLKTISSVLQNKSFHIIEIEQTDDCTVYLSYPDPRYTVVFSCEDGEFSIGNVNKHDKVKMEEGAQFFKFPMFV